MGHAPMQDLHAISAFAVMQCSEADDVLLEEHALLNQSSSASTLTGVLFSAHVGRNIIKPVKLMIGNLGTCLLHLKVSRQQARVSYLQCHEAWVAHSPIRPIHGLRER